MENLTQIIAELSEDNRRLVSNQIFFDDKGILLIARCIIEKDMPEERVYLEVFIKKEPAKIEHEKPKLERKLNWPILAVIAFCFAVWLLLIYNLFL